MVLQWLRNTVAACALVFSLSAGAGVVATASGIRAAAWAAPPAKGPTVSMTAPLSGATFTAGANITLTATALDSSSTISNVNFYRGSTTLIGTATTPPYTITWSNVPAGSYSLTAKATDAAGASATSSAVSITVKTPTDQPPTVAITSPSNNAALAAPASFTISATANDSDGTVSKVAFYDGAALLGTVNGSSATLNASWPVSNMGAGTHVLTAVATDNAGLNTNSVPVNVAVNTAPLVVLTSPKACAGFIGPTTIMINATADDPDGIASIAYYANGALIHTDTFSSRWTMPATGYQWANVANGTYVLTLVATNSHGVSTTSSPVQITVHADFPPTVSITSPGGNASFVAGSAITVAANAADSDGTVTKVDFYANGALIGSSSYGSYSMYSISWTPTLPGTVSLTAVATDDGGFTTTSAAMQVNITPAHAPPTVSMSAATDTNPAYAPSVAHLRASATAATGFSVSTIAFYANGTLIGSGSTGLLDWLAQASGSYSLTAVATDNSGYSTTSSPVTVTLNPSTVTYLHPDLLGSAVVGTSSSGAVAWKMHYAPFGERLDNPPASATGRLGYTGQPFDAESGLGYHGARYYDATIGRFYGIDTVEVNPNNIYSFNRYSYADNNPYAKYDPSGRDAIWIRNADGTVTLLIPVKFVGQNATPQNIAAIVARDNSLNIADPKLRMDVVATDTPILGVLNTMDFSPGYNSEICGSVGECINTLGGNNGHINSDSGHSIDAAAHDNLHFAGIADQYIEGPKDADGHRTNTPTPGYDDTNIMTSRNGTDLKPDQFNEAESNSTTNTQNCSAGSDEVTPICY